MVQHGEKAYPYEMTGRSRSASTTTVTELRLGNRCQDEAQQPRERGRDTAPYAQEEDVGSLQNLVNMSQSSEADPVSAV